MRIAAVGPEALEEGHALLAAAWPFDRFSATLAREKLFDGFHPGVERSTVFAARSDEGRLVGVMQSVVRPAEGRAWLGLFAVAAADRNRGVASALFARVSDEWMQAGVGTAEVLAVPSNYFTPGLDPRAPAAAGFLARHGFARAGEAVSLVVDLGVAEAFDTTADERRLGEAGIEIRRAAPEDESRLDAFVTERFGSDWGFQAERARRLSPPGVHVALAGDGVVGFAAHSAMNREWGWFGPMGTAAEAEGRGIGRVLLRRSLRDLGAQGYATAIIPWVASKTFYARHVPCQAERVFWRYHRVVASPAPTSQ